MARAFPSSIAANIDKAVKGSFDEYLVAQNSGLPRLAILAATSKHDHIVNSVAGFEQYPQGQSSPGSADLSSTTPLTENSLFPLWSATKLCTVIATLQLVEQGRIALKDEASKYVKELQDMKVLKGFSDDDEPIYEDAEKGCTIDELLLHTAGFSFSYNPLVSKMEKRTGEPWVYAEKATRESLTKVPYVFQPGTGFAYGSSTDWLALAVAEASGQSFDVYLKENLFDPLEITNMTFDNPTNRVDMATIPPLPADSKPDAAHPPYTFSNMNFPTSIAFGGAGLTGSPKSYLEILRMLLRGGACPSSSEGNARRILKPDTVDMMFEPRFTIEDKESPIVKTFLPFVTERMDPWSHRSGKQFDGCGYAYGGLTCGEGFPSGRSKGSLAWSGAANAFWVVDRSKDVAFCVWTSLIPHSHEALMKVWAEAETLLYKGLEEMQEK